MAKKINFSQIVSASFQRRNIPEDKFRVYFRHHTDNWPKRTICYIQEREDTEQRWKDTKLPYVAEGLAKVNASAGDNYDHRKGRVLSYKRAVEQLEKVYPQFRRVPRTR